MPSLLDSDYGRLCRDGSALPSQTQSSSKRQVSDLAGRKQGFQLKKIITCLVAWQQRLMLRITIASQAKLPRFQSFANENEDLSDVCQTFCLSEQNVQQDFQTCQICRFRNVGVNQTRISSLPSLPFSELVPIKLPWYPGYNQAHPINVETE